MSKRVDLRVVLLRAWILLGVLFVSAFAGAFVSLPSAWSLAPKALTAPAEARLSSLDLRAPSAASASSAAVPSCERRARPLGDNEAERSRYDGTQVQQLTLSRRAPAHCDRWLKHAAALGGYGALSSPVMGAALSIPGAAAPHGTERRNDIDRAQAEADAYAPRGPPADRRA